MYTINSKQKYKISICIYIVYILDKTAPSSYINASRTHKIDTLSTSNVHYAECPDGYIC